ncbi:MAG: ribbon-helix-helix protein, CopG family [Chloroflexota bacterium]
MERTQISLSSRQAQELRRLAGKRNTSMAALIREAVDRTYGLDSGLDARWERALSSIGGFNSGRSDISEHHDEFAFERHEE